jgi:pSer/pThr/pTyr-binding forkhead associated (FHA) protein
MSITCKNCGHSGNAPDAVYCEACGQELKASNLQPPPFINNNPPQPTVVQTPAVTVQQNSSPPPPFINNNPPPFINNNPPQPTVVQTPAVTVSQNYSPPPFINNNPPPFVNNNPPPPTVVNNPPPPPFVNNNPPPPPFVNNNPPPPPFVNNNPPPPPFVNNPNIPVSNAIGNTAKLVAKQPGCPISEFVLDGSNAIIGKFDPDTGPVDIDLEGFPHEETISRQHGAIYREGGQWKIQDLGSVNGIFIKRSSEIKFSARITSPTIINMEDEIAIAKIRFIFQIP